MQMAYRIRSVSDTGCRDHNTYSGSTSCLFTGPSGGSPARSSCLFDTTASSPFALLSPSFLSQRLVPSARDAILPSCFETVPVSVNQIRQRLGVTNPSLPTRYLMSAYWGEWRKGALVGLVGLVGFLLVQLELV